MFAISDLLLNSFLLFNVRWRITVDQLALE
jgi:hypothetical protein